MGVLMTLQSLEGAKLAALEVKPDIETLGWGMEFLQATSNQSPLSARYVAMLQKMRRKPIETPRQAPVPVPQPILNPPVSGPNPTGIIQINQNNNILMAGNGQPGNMSITEQHQYMGGYEPTWQFRPEQMEYVPFDPDYMVFNDFLSGTGLPRDFLSTQYQDVDVIM